jgi:hypothetical protein
MRSRAANRTPHSPAACVTGPGTATVTVALAIP